MTEKRSKELLVLPCFTFIKSYSYISELTMKYTTPIEVFFLVTLIKSERKLNHVYIII